MLLIPSKKKVASSLSASLKAFATAQKAAIAVEFALIAPLLVFLFFATFELARALDCRSRVVNAASTTADLVAQSSSISSSDASTILCAAKAIIYPYSTSSTVKMVITNIVCTDVSTSSTCSNGNGTIAISWSMATSNTTKRTTVPTNLSTSAFTASGTGVVLVEISYAYASATTQFLASSITMAKSAYAVPRSNTAVSGTSGTITDSCSI